MKLYSRHYMQPAALVAVEAAQRAGYVAYWRRNSAAEEPWEVWTMSKDEYLKQLEH